MQVIVVVAVVVVVCGEIINMYFQFRDLGKKEKQLEEK